MRPYILCLLALAVLVVSGCGEHERNDTGVYDHVFSKNGITFSEPYLSIRGDKEKDMSFVIWVNFTSSSSRCLGGFIRDGRDSWSYYPGGNEGAKKPGVIKRMFAVLPGKNSYSIDIPIAVRDARECTWTLQEIQMQVTGSFIGNRTDDLASFVLVEEADYALFEPRYDIYCQKQQGRFSQFDCRHKSQNGKNVIVSANSVRTGVNTTINVKASPDVRTVP